MATSKRGGSVTMISRVNGEREKTPYDVALDWIYEQKTEVERAPFGGNKATVGEAVERGNRRSKTIALYQKQIDLVGLQVNSEKKKNLQVAYEALKMTAQKKMNCQKSMMDIASLEEQCGNISNVFDTCAVQMVGPAERTNEDAATDKNIPGFLSLSSQDCIFAMSDNWGWIVRLVQCIDLHLKNASSYQQFFHEVDETAPRLVADLRRLHKSFDLHHLKGDYKDAQKLLRELEDITVALQQWECKSNHMWEKACKLVPVHFRTTAVTSPLPIRAVCHYDSSEIKVRDGEDLLLIDNSKTNNWKVRNAAGVEADVPALCLLIPGPCKEAMDAAIMMRMQLLAEWTNTIKRIGQRLICFMLLVFQSDYEDAKIKLMKSIGPEDKRSLLRILDFIEDTLRVHWSDHEGFNTLQERMLMVRMILKDTTGNDAIVNKDNTSISLVVQVNMLEKLMQKYKDLWRWWEQFKVALETSRAPEMMLIVDKWQQLKFVSPADFAKYWKSSLQFDDLEKSLLGLRHLADEGSANLGEHFEENEMQRTIRTMLGLEGVNGAKLTNGCETIRQASVGEQSMEEEGFDEIGESTIHKASVGETEHGAFGYATERKTAETEQLSQAESEEKKTFVIRAVIDLDTDNEISLQEAIKKGILIPAEGIYVNVNTGERLPIAVAMNQGLIKVELTTTRRTQEKKSSMGIITVKTIRETIRPYTITAVTDTRDNTSVTLDVAVTKKIIDEGRGTFTDMRRRRETTIVEAIEQGMVQVEFDGEAPEPEVVSQVYAVRAVLDVKRQTTVSFAEAVRRGIIDKSTGAFRNTLTHDQMYVGDAIMRGFLKARPISDAKNLDIDPENEMTVDKTEEGATNSETTAAVAPSNGHRTGRQTTTTTTTTVKKSKIVNSFRKAASLIDNGI